MKNEATLKRIRREATKSCRARGHIMEWQKPERETNRISQTAYCARCGMMVALDTCPPPNGIDVGGAAVALHCDGK